MFSITERVDYLAPRPTDRKAGICSRHSGTFDLRDPQGKVIVTGTSLKALRKLQADYNTRFYLDGFMTAQGK